MKSSTLIGNFLLSAIANTHVASAAEEQPIILLSEDPTFHYEILGGLGQALYGGADIAPLLAAAKDVKPGDFQLFGDVLYKLANDTKTQALDPANAYDPVNVRDTWFSTANYFRRADAFSKGDWDNPIINEYWDEQLAAFNQGLASLPIPGERVLIPADNFTVEAVWYSASADKSKKLPTLIVGNGFDAAQEDLYHNLVAPALARGWNALTYEGPGQPTVRRSQNLAFIHEWERVVTPAVDYVLSNKSAEVDTEKLVLFGNSMGGYLAARAAAFEPRLSALLLNGGVFDVHAGYVTQLPDELAELYDSGDKVAFDQAANAVISDPETPSNVRWGLEYGFWAFKTKSAYDFFELTKPFNLKDVIDRIQIPVWIADFELEDIFNGQPQQVQEALGDKATVHRFTGSAGYHCESGAFQEMNRVIFAWLHKTLG